jgi:Arc/MetJ-type ribon-helix-helix transcriptional regulator
MSYAFPPDVADLVQQAMATGNFASEDDVLRAALQAHLECDDVQSGLQSGIDDMESGRVTILADVDNAMRAKYSIPREQ